MSIPLPSHWTLSASVPAGSASMTAPSPSSLWSASKKNHRPSLEAAAGKRGETIARGAPSLWRSGPASSAVAAISRVGSERQRQAGLEARSAPKGWRVEMRYSLVSRKNPRRLVLPMIEGQRFPMILSTPRLETFELRASRASPVCVGSFGPLAAMPKLRELRWGFVRDAPPITDALVASLAGSRSLERVDFAGDARVELGDAGFAAFGSMPSLRRVGMESCKPSLDALDALDALGRPLGRPQDFFDVLAIVEPWAPPHALPVAPR